MNVIVIMNDTFRRDHLGFYGNPWIHTPNLDRFARESVIFDRAYIASYPNSDMISRLKGVADGAIAQQG